MPFTRFCLSNLGIDWEKELKPHYDTASKMLGIVKNPVMDVMGRLSERSGGEKMGRRAIHSGLRIPASTLGHRKCLLMIPSSMGRDLHVWSVIFVGECLTGCKHARKRTGQNYLYLAQKYGRQSCPYPGVTNIIPQPKRHIRHEGEGQLRAASRKLPILGKKK